MSIKIGYFIMLLSVAIASFSQILLKKGADRKYDSIIREYLNVYVISGYGFMVISMLCNILAYRSISYKDGPVIESLGFLLVMILSFFFFKEPITKKKVIGNLLIFTGIFIFYL